MITVSVGEVFLTNRKYVTQHGRTELTYVHVKFVDFSQTVTSYGVTGVSQNCTIFAAFHRDSQVLL